MPQLRKVALAMGNRLAYQDTYEQAIQQLIQELSGTSAPAPTQTGNEPTAAAAPAPPPPSPQAVQAIRTLNEIKGHLQRYRELSAQGKWAEAGKELDAIQGLVQQK
jgi:uncharacterized membrane protein (UPF0182 family)